MKHYRKALEIADAAWHLQHCAEAGGDDEQMSLALDILEQQIDTLRSELAEGPAPTTDNLSAMGFADPR